MLMVGIGGIAQSGKTTTSKMLASMLYHSGWHPIQMSMADVLKKAAARLGIGKDVDPKAYRAFCQKYGEMRRDPNFRPGVSGPDYWVKRFSKAMDRRLGPEHDRKVVIIDDIRYDSERQMVTEHGGALVYIDALHRLKDQLEEPWMQHSSEQLAINYGKGLLPDNTFDFIIANNGSLSSLEKKTLALAVKIGPYVNT